MAEYAGLEIRIGGDTTKLTNALKAPTKSAAELQRRIRQATRAMQFDPTDLKNVDTRIKVTGNRMESLQSKAQLARTAMEQLGDSLTGIMNAKGEPKTVRQLASETENLSLKAKQADERFNGLTGTLATIYETWNRSARSEGVDILKAAGIDQKTAEVLMGTKTSLATLRTELKGYQDEAVSHKSDLMFSGKIIDISDEDIEKVTRLKELNFHDMFGQGLGLDEAIKQAGELGIAIEDSAVTNVKKLQETFKAAQTEKKAFDDALKFEQLGTDIQRLDSEAESLSQTMRKLDDSVNITTKTDRFQGLEDDIRRVDAALGNVERDLERTGEAMKADPKNVELAARYFGDLQQKANLSKEKIELLGKQMDMLDASGAKEAAKEHKDLAKWVEDSAESARVANKELSNQRATVANLEDGVTRLGQRIADMKGGSTIVEYSDAVQRWKKETERLENAMGDLATKEGIVANRQEELNKAQVAFDKAKAEAMEYESQLESLKKEYAELSAEMERAFGSGHYDPSMDAYLSGLETDIEHTEKVCKGAATNVKELGRELDGAQERADLAGKSMKLASDDVDDLKRSVDELAKTPEVKFFKNPGDEIGKAEDELSKLNTRLDEARSKEDQLENAYSAARSENELAKTAQAAQKVSQEANEAKTSLNEAEAALSTSSASILNASTVKSLGMTLSAVVTPAIAGIGYKMVDASSTVDAAYRDMRKTVEGTEEQFESLRQHAIEFSRTHVTSADQILQIEAIGGELGIATENLETFAEVISNIDVATNLDVEGAADALGHLSNILHLSEDDYVGFSDALVRLGNNGASTETEIANIAERIGSMGSIVGMSGSDVLAWASSLASTGQNAEAAATALSKTWSFMETSVAAAGGTMDTSFKAVGAAVEEGGDRLTVFANLAGQTADEFAEAWESDSKSAFESLKEGLDGAKDGLQMIADVAHMSADDFARTWESDPTEAARAFIEGLNDIEASGGSADKVLQSLGITAVRQKQGIEGLMQTIGGLDTNLRMSEDAWNGISDKWGKAGDAANEAQKKAEGFSGQMQILKNITQNFLSELGEGAVPWIQMFTDKISGLSEFFSGLDKSTKTAVVGIGGFIAALGPMLSFGSTIATAKGELIDWFNSAISGMNLVKLAYKHGGEEMVKSLASGGAEAKKAFLGTIGSMEKVKVVALELGSAMAKGLAVGVALVAIAAVGAELEKLYRRYKDNATAAGNMKAALSDLGKVADVTAASFDRTGGQLSQLVDYSRDYGTRLNDLAKTIEDSNSQYGTYAGQLDYYGSVVSELGGKADRTREESYKLEAALQAVNDACGTTYGLDEYGNIIDTQTGKIQDDTTAILANIDARKAQALVDYYSDDYQKAVGEWADAQERLNDAQTELNRLTEEGGKEKYLDFAKQVYGATYDEEKVLAAYEAEVRDAQEAVSNYTKESEAAQDAMDRLSEKISGAEEEQRKQKEAIDAAAAAQEEYGKRSETVSSDVTGNMKRMSDSMDELGKSDEDFNAVVTGLEAISVRADELNDVDMGRLASSFDDANGSMADVIATLEDGNVHMDTWNAALEQAPDAAENMGSLTAAAFQSMYEQAGGSIEDTMTLIAGLDTVQVEDKTFYIGDNGSIIDSQGKVYDLKRDITAVPDSVITAYTVNDTEGQKKLLDAKKKAEEVNRQRPTPVLAVQDNASRPTRNLFNDLNAVGRLSPTPNVNLTDNASLKIGNINRGLANLPRNTTLTVTTVERKVKQATGGMNNRPVIPRHATGYIATGPTLTNQGWIGEDGIEAVANWATGGAVVPLTNKKYMLPIAEAIADGMSRRVAGSTEGNVINITVNGVSGPDEVAQAVARELVLMGMARGRR